MRRLRVYVDTSVIGGCFDEEFAEESRALIEAAREGRFVLLLSDLLAVELGAGPPELQDVLEGLAAESFESVAISEESVRLRDAYLMAGVVGPPHDKDAHHIALATVARQTSWRVGTSSTLCTGRRCGGSTRSICGKDTRRLRFTRPGRWSR